MRHLTTAFRYGEAHVQLDRDLVHITTDIEFSNLIVSYVTPDMISNQIRELNLTVMQAYRRLLRLGNRHTTIVILESNSLLTSFTYIHLGFKNRT